MKVPNWLGYKNTIKMVVTMFAVTLDVRLKKKEMARPFFCCVTRRVATNRCENFRSDTIVVEHQEFIFRQMVLVFSVK